MVEWAIFSVWIGAPVLYLLFALRAALERFSKNKDAHPGEYLVSALFLAVVGGVSFLVHYYWLDTLMAFLPFDLPRNVYLVALWPFFLFVGAKLIGPSREILISQAPSLGKRKPQR